MSEEKDTYRPKSPDLSGFRIPSYPPPDASFPPGFAFSPRGSYDASPYFSPHNSQPSSYFGSQPHSQPLFGFVPKLSRTPFVPTLPSNQFSQSSASYSQPRQPPPTFLTPSYLSQTLPHEPLYDSPVTSQHPEMPRIRGNRFAPTADAEYDPNPNPNPLPSGPIVPAMSNINIAAASSDSNPALEVDVKTKFPVARIKRIMQADEDVGKVAQATPTAVAKALELFMITLVLKGANAAKDQNSKRVTRPTFESCTHGGQGIRFLGRVLC